MKAEKYQGQHLASWRSIRTKGTGFRLQAGEEGRRASVLGQEVKLVKSFFT